MTGLIVDLDCGAGGACIPPPARNARRTTEDRVMTTAQAESKVVPASLIIDLFCGAGLGGWAAGLEMLGHDPADTLGFEHDRHAAATHTAAGFPTVVGDLSAVPVDLMSGVDGLIASPPCQAFSMAGKGKGRDAIADLLAHIALCADGWVPPAGDLCADDVRADLTLQPLKWADALRPTWIVCEQVPPVLPAWEHMARVLEQWGYSAWTGLLSAERWGVPQTRKRAILIARRDGTPAVPPTPTHTAYDHRAPDGGRTPLPSLFDDDLLPWVSMADALGWGDHTVNYAAGAMAHAAARSMDEPASTLAFGHNVAQHQWQYVNGTRDNAATRDPERWQLSLAGKTGLAHRDADLPATPITGAGNAVWTTDRPATTVVGSFRPDIIAAPGWRGAGDGPRQNAEGSVRVTVEQAAALQSFPPGWPWQGPKTSRYRQIGNAVPPLLAAAVLSPLLDRHPRDAA